MLAATSAATFHPVDNGVAALQSVYPGARVTSGYRRPDNPLSQANPRSWHTQSHAAVDVAPISGMNFDQFVGGLRGAGYGIIEQRDEVNNPSRHATGPHWHVVLGKGR